MTNPKIAILNIDDLSDLMDEIFSFHDGEGKYYHFNATKIRKHIKDNPQAAMFVKTELTEDIYNHVIQNNGVETQKIHSLLAVPEIVAEPILLVEWPDGQHTCIDGNHRLVIHWRLGMRAIGAYVIKLAECEPFLVPFPDELGPIFTAQD